MASTIRPARPEDAGAILAIYAPVVRETWISFELEPPTPVEMRERITHTLARFPWLVMESDGHVRGYAYASGHRERPAYQWSVDVSVYVAASGRRQRVASRLYVALLSVLELQGFRNAFAGIALPNEASVRAHESLGFEPIGVYRSVGFKLGAWRDVGWWQRRIGAEVANPVPPIPFTALIGGERLQAALNGSRATP